MGKLKLCRECKNFELDSGIFPCSECLNNKDKPRWKSKKSQKINESIMFPILNNLTPTIPSCTAKVYEEIGELMQLLGKGQQQSGELTEALNNRSEWVRRTVEEALDGAQALVTLVNTLLDEPGDIEISMERHIEKLRGKGYLK